MASNLLTKYKQNIIDEITASITGPVNGLLIANSGTGYSNSDTLVFTRSVFDPNSGANAAGTISTDANGVILTATITQGGSYSLPPTVSITSNTGNNAAITATLNNTIYYLFLGRTEPYTDENTADPVVENDFSGFRRMYDQMVIGTKLDTTNFNPLVPMVKWTSNTVYAEFDDQDNNITTDAFYVLTSNNKVFKCIYNNFGAPSTIEPTDSTPSGMPSTLSDGYRWYYLYSITNTQNTTFSTSNYMPVFKEANVVANAISGAILNVKVTSSGNGYPAANGTITFANNGTILISSSVVSIPNYYANSTLTVVGNNNLVTNHTILSSSSNNGAQQVRIANTFTANEIAPGYTFTIGPTVNVVGDGSGFKGHCVMNANNGSVISINVFNAGNGYNYANVTFVAASGLGSGATARAVISPPGGHGADPVAELFCEHLGVSGTFSNTISAFNQDFTFRTIGIVKNPISYGNTVAYPSASFSQTVKINVANVNMKSFANGEYAYGKSSGARVVIVSSNSSVATVSGFDGKLIAGETLTGATSNAAFTINSIANQPALDLYSGQIIYLNNILPAIHSSNTSEQIRIVIKV